MRLTKRQADPAAEDRTSIGELTRLGATPGQRLLFAVTAISASALIIGAVGYQYVYPAWKGENKPQKAKDQAAQQQQLTAAPPPKLNVPLDLNAQNPQAGTMPGMITPQTKPTPPGLIGAPGSTPPAQADAGHATDDPQAAQKQQAAESRKLAGDLGGENSQKPTTEPQPIMPAQKPAATTQASGTPLQFPAPLAAPRSPLEAALVPTVTPSATAKFIPNQRMILGKGTSITCNLDTAIQTDQNGFVSCLTDYPVMSMDGRVVLAERGTKINGEYVKGIDRGSKAIFVLWTEARTPTGVTIPLASPGTDALGRAGVHGEVDEKFWERFKGAFMFSIFKDISSVVVSRATNGNVNGSGNNNVNGGAVVVTPSNTQATAENAIGELLKTGNEIRPTLYKNQGETVGITVARDIDFSGVYKLTLRNNE